MIYCQKQVLLFMFYLIFCESLAKNDNTALTEALFDDDQKHVINLEDISKQSSFAEQEGNESEKDYESFLSGNLQKHHKKVTHVDVKGPKKWDQWSKWSPCSVTCGVGKITRWRHCISEGCADGEKEAQIKSCTLPTC